MGIVIVQNAPWLNYGEQIEGEKTSWKRCRDQLGDGFVNPERNNGGVPQDLSGRGQKEAEILVEYSFSTVFLYCVFFLILM